MKQQISRPLASTTLFLSLLAAPCAALAQSSNACPVDGCDVEIISATPKDGELLLEFKANYLPDMSKNHIHVWWGENFDIKQVSNNAETVYGVTQGDWHPTASYPEYLTSSGASVSVRGEATTLCVTASDRNHDILDPAHISCFSVKDQLGQ